MTLEQEGLFIPQLGTFLKGTVQCVVSDNVGAHGLAGFVESFSGIYFADIVQLRVASFRSRKQHRAHVKPEPEKAISCTLQQLKKKVSAALV